MEHIYLILSATSGHMGKFIRRVTNMPYNHISFSFDANLHDMVSFARYYYKTPFYGGFVHESKERYRHADILLYEVPVQKESYEKIHHLISEMDRHSQDYLYHTINAILSPLHKSLYIKKAHTCVSFIDMLLHQSELPFDTFYDIRQIKEKLNPYLIYEGTMDVFEIQSDPSYMKPITLVDIVKLSFVQHCRLVLRIFKNKNSSQR